jgi:hypothetical protein
VRVSVEGLVEGEIAFQGLVEELVKELVKGTQNGGKGATVASEDHTEGGGVSRHFTCASPPSRRCSHSHEHRQRHRRTSA